MSAPDNNTVAWFENGAPDVGADLEPGDGVVGGSGHGFLRQWALCND